MPLELWGGHECTVNRVGDRWLDQTRRGGHEQRLDDLQRFADLGLKALRYPVLWERVSPDHPDQRNWTWSDERLAEIRRLGVRPIVGLVHHGSGPHWTSLTSDDFADGLAAHARAVAERYPWVEDWTPVNEPLTTARFSALYGHWYPHATDDGSFWTALLIQINATRLAMRAIREVIPHARLVQTEDLGQTYSTPELAGWARFCNERRWLSWDLLTGKVDENHPQWWQVQRNGAEDRVRLINADPCPPDVIGVNHYVTSERFLDQRTDRYPGERVGAEGFVDITAARVLRPEPVGFDGLLRQTWERYGLPIAVTECHLGCTREEQLRWFAETWTIAERLRTDGVDLRAVTAWALLGSVDWNSLLTRDAGHYEPGAFDLRGPEPRPTALAKLLTELGHGRDPKAASGADRAILSTPGWWRREVRLEHAPYVWRNEVAEPAGQPDDLPPILIAGATGTLGQAFAGACRLRGLPHLLTNRRALPLDDPRAMARTLDEHRPWAVVNAAGWVRVDEAEAAEAACTAANATGAIFLARLCAERGIHHTAFSSDLVFDGAKEGSYVEDDAPNPLNAYGRSKAALEEGVLATGGTSLVIRTAAFFSPHDPHNFAAWIERELRAGRARRAADGFVVTPTYVPDLVSATLDLAIDGDTGLRHLSSGAALSWLSFGRLVAARLGFDPERVRPADPAELGWRALRPRQAALGTARGQLLPRFDDALDRHAARRAREQTAEAGAGTLRSVA